MNFQDLKNKQQQETQKELENILKSYKINLEELIETYIEQKYNHLYELYVAFPVEVIAIVIEFENNLSKFKSQ